jgi:hypothetical protein
MAGPPIDERQRMKKVVDGGLSREYPVFLSLKGAPRAYAR